jgi:predicted lipoprotein
MSKDRLLCSRVLLRASLRTKLLLLVACSAAAVVGCTKLTHMQDVADAPARRVLLKNLSEQVILPVYEDFADKAAQLQTALQDHVDVHTDSTRFQAQAVLRAALLAWEQAEVYQIGPAAEISSFNPGSAGLRSEIYAWDNDDPCVVDRGLIQKLYESDDFAKGVYFYGRGLGAIERLLFDLSTNTACAATDKIATPDAWQELVDGDLEDRRARYALRCAEIISDRAQTLVSAFRDDFMPELVNAGAGSRTFASTQEALNTVTNALFYVDVEVRDLKVGWPIGHSMECMDKPCSTEVAFGGFSREAILANLDALEAVFVGAPPDDARGDAMWGLSDLLRSVQAGSTADEIEGLIDAAQAAVKGLGERFDDTPRDPSVHGAAAFDALQALSDGLKTEFLQKLGLNPPMRAAGDND